MPAKKPTPSQLHCLAIVDAILAAGLVPDGETRTEVARMATSDGGSEVRTFGGRERYAMPGSDLRVTVGKLTTFVYRLTAGKVSPLARLSTQDTDPATLTRDLLAWSTDR